jgi:hypothetical protein
MIKVVPIGGAIDLIRYRGANATRGALGPESR